MPSKASQVVRLKRSTTRKSGKAYVYPSLPLPRVLPRRLAERLALCRDWSVEIGDDGTLTYRPLNGA